MFSLRRKISQIFFFFSFLAKVDKYGRKMQTEEFSDVKRFYEFDEEENEKMKIFKKKSVK